MKKYYVEKRFLTKVGKTRISIMQDDDATNPRVWTDEPLHCQDFSRECTIMTKQERETKKQTMSGLLTSLLKDYGDQDKIMATLYENGKHMTDGERVIDDALVYDKSQKCWKLMAYDLRYNYDTLKNERCWDECGTFYCKRDEIDVYAVIDTIGDDTIDYMIAHCMTNDVKMMSYGFGYYGGISFYDEVECSSEGIAWLDKKEFLKYSGLDEDTWNAKSLKEIEFLLGELEAWSIGDAYGFIVEEKKEVNCTEEYADGRTNKFVRVDWDIVDSCSGFYGELDKRENDILECAGFKKDELVEE